MKMLRIKKSPPPLYIVGDRLLLIMKSTFSVTSYFSTLCLLFNCFHNMMEATTSIIVVITLPSIPNAPPCKASGPFVVDRKNGVENIVVPLTAKPYTLYCAQFHIECQAQIPERLLSFNTYKADKHTN